MENYISFVFNWSWLEYEYIRSLKLHGIPYINFSRAYILRACKPVLISSYKHEPSSSWIHPTHDINNTSFIFIHCASDNAPKWKTSRNLSKRNRIPKRYPTIVHQLRAITKKKKKKKSINPEGSSRVDFYFSLFLVPERKVKQSLAVTTLFVQRELTRSESSPAWKHSEMLAFRECTRRRERFINNLPWPRVVLEEGAAPVAQSPQIRQSPLVPGRVRFRFLRGGARLGRRAICIREILPGDLQLIRQLIRSSLGRLQQLFLLPQRLLRPARGRLSVRRVRLGRPHRVCQRPQLEEEAKKGDLSCSQPGYIVPQTVSGSWKKKKKKKTSADLTECLVKYERVSEITGFLSELEISLTREFCWLRSNFYWTGSYLTFGRTKFRLTRCARRRKREVSYKMEDMLLAKEIWNFPGSLITFNCLRAPDPGTAALPGSQHWR